MLAFLLTMQRTGSGALGSILHRHPQLFNTGEILHPDDARNKVNFFNYLATDPAFPPLYANPGTREAFIKRYLAWLEASAAPRWPVLDIKYRSLQHWNQGWHGLQEQPWVIAYAKRNKLPILHLIRRNLAATFVSGRLADANQVWHAKDEAEVKVTSLPVVPQDLLNFIRASHREIVQMRDWLGKYERVLTLAYEDMLDEEGNMPPSIAAEIAGFLGIEEFTKLNSVFVKQAPPRLAASITNFDEVMKALRDTEFSWMLRAG